uniref:NAD(P)-binding protein n=1 Tax=Steinernema glaseri TaxID=37863 RepID=A0A1I7YZK1_9BILA
MAHNFAGKVVIVTGSSTGIGQGIALLFAQRGAYVTIHGIDGDEVEVAYRSLLDNGISPERLLAICGNLTEAKTAEELVQRTVEKWAKIDVLVNNAGVDSKPGVPLDSEENFDFTFAVNVKAIVRINKLAIPHLEKTRGNIVNTCSITALTRIKGAPTFYAMSKAALDHYVKYEAPSLVEKGIRMNNIAPGLVCTHIRWRVGFSHEWFQQMAKECSERNIPLGRPGTPGEMANAVAFLASEEASYICGTTFVVDGGGMLGK